MISLRYCNFTWWKLGPWWLIYFCHILIYSYSHQNLVNLTLILICMTLSLVMLPHCRCCWSCPPHFITSQEKCYFQELCNNWSPNRVTLIGCCPVQFFIIWTTYVSIYNCEPLLLPHYGKNKLELTTRGRSFQNKCLFSCSVRWQTFLLHALQKIQW